VRGNVDVPFGLRLQSDGFPVLQRRLCVVSAQSVVRSDSYRYLRREYLSPFSGDFVEGFVELGGHFRKFIGDGEG